MIKIFFVSTLMALSLSFSVFAMETNTEIKISIYAKTKVEHKDVWIAFMSKGEKGISAICNAFLVTHEAENLFRAGIPELPIEGEIIKIGLYVGGPNIALANFELNGDLSAVKEIIIEWDQTQTNFFQNIANMPAVKIISENGSEKIALANPVMIIPGLKYEDSINGSAMSTFTEMLLEDLKRFDFNFAYEIDVIID